MLIKLTIVVNYSFIDIINIYCLFKIFDKNAFRCVIYYFYSIGLSLTVFVYRHR